VAGERPVSSGVCCSPASFCAQEAGWRAASSLEVHHPSPASGRFTLYVKGLVFFRFLAGRWSRTRTPVRPVREPFSRSMTTWPVEGLRFLSFFPSSCYVACMKAQCAQPQCNIYVPPHFSFPLRPVRRNNSSFPSFSLFFFFERARQNPNEITNLFDFLNKI